MIAPCADAQQEGGDIGGVVPGYGAACRRDDKEDIAMLWAEGGVPTGEKNITNFRRRGNFKSTKEVVGMIAVVIFILYVFQM